jgi:hypothetical protein
MLRDLGNEDLAIDQHSAALVPLLQDRLATATREIDEPDRQGMVRNTEKSSAPRRPRMAMLQARWTSGINGTTAMIVRWSSPLGSLTLTRFVGSKPTQSQSMA